MALAAWLALHAGVSALATWLALAYARHRKLVDLPGERRSHAVATPRGGGIGIACALLAGCTALLLGAGGESCAALACFAIGLVLVAGIGWIDDHRPLSPWLRLAVQCLAGAVLAWGEPGDSPLWEGRDEVGEQGRAYVCRGSVCEQPVTTTEDLRHRLLGH